MLANRPLSTTRSLSKVVSFHLACVALCASWLLGSSARTLHAQDVDNQLFSIGVPNYETELPVENGSIRIASGSLHLEIPLGSFPQRAGRQFKASLVYDSNIWAPNTPPSAGLANNIFATNLGCPNQGPDLASLGGWRLITSADAGCVDYTETDYNTCQYQGQYEEGRAVYKNFVWYAPDGTTHKFSMTAQQGIPNHCGSNSGYDQAGSSLAQDSTGYFIAADINFHITVRAPDGSLVYGCLPSGCAGLSTDFEDPNGNYFGSTLRDSSFSTNWPAGYFPTSGSITDSLGRTLLTVSQSGTTVYLDVLNSQGTTSRYTLTTGQFEEYYGIGQTYWITVITSVQLPDGSSYSFLYDCSGNSICGTVSAGMVGIASMRLPTGGQIKYTYASLKYQNSLITTAVTSRTTPDSQTPWNYALTWNYSTCTPANAQQVPNLCIQTLTVTKPNGDNEVYTDTPCSFGLQHGEWPTETQYYQGSVSSANVLATINQSFANCIGAQLQSRTITLPVSGTSSISQTSKFAWDTSEYGHLLTRQDWNFGSNTSGNPDKTTTYTYWSDTHSAYVTANVLIPVASKTITNSSGVTIAQTVSSYDGSTLVSGAVGTCPAVTNSAGHDDTNYGTGNTVRGNLTQAQQLLSGSNYLITSKTYDITGQVRTSVDSNSNTTTYCFADAFFNDGSSPTNPTNPPASYTPATATNAYLTTLIHPTVNSITQTEKFGYYWGTGQKALSTDENNQTTYFHYSDPLNRSTSTELSNQGWNYSAYTGETQVDTGIGITSTTLSASCTGTSGGCRHDQTNLDGLGRPSTKILVSDPDGQDTVLTTYDSNGRVQAVSNPYRSLSSPTDGTETYGYDGLDRKTTITHADNNIAYTYYGTNAGTNGGLSAQKCSGFGTGYPILSKDEAGNVRETWTDGFGRLIEVDEPNTSGSLSSGSATCYAYDLNNNLIGVLQPGSESTCSLNGVTYNRCFTYDMASRLTAATNPETAASISTGSGTINYYYTTTTSGTTPCSGDPTAVCLRIEPKPNQASSATVQTTYTYDALNRLTSKTYNDSTTATVLYGYDAVNPSGCTPPTLTITNGLGRRTSMCDGSGSTAWSYDQVGNKLTEVRKITTVNPNVSKTVSAGYNLDSSIKTLTYPSGRTVTYTTGNAQRTTTAYDSTNTYAQGPPSTSSCPFNESNNMGWACYTPSGQLDELRNGSSLTTTKFYNNRLQPCRIAVNTTGGNTPPASCGDSNTGDKFDIQYSFDLSSLPANLCSLTYGSYTNNGNVASITNKMSGMSNRSQQFCYDALNRISTAQTTGIYSTSPQYCWAEAYAIDPIANLSQIAQVSSNHNGSYVNCTEESGFSATINPHNQDSLNCYDAAGNNVGPSGGSCTNLPTTYWYDAENRICSYGGLGNCTSGTIYTYDGDDNRVEKSNATLYWYGPTGEVIAETTTTGSNQDEYVFFGGKRIARINPSGTVFYYFADSLGTSRVNVQDGSTPTLCYDADFYPYGIERTPYTNTCSQNYKFTGKERDQETNNDYFGARYYRSALGRFMSVDWSAKPEPVPYAKIGSPQSLNLYSYVDNNPLNATDSDGHACDSWLGDEHSAFCERAARYGFLSDFVQGSRTTRFFDAAEATSRALADVRAHWGPVSLSPVSAEAADFLESIGEDLADFNEQKATAIVNGSLGGKDLDKRMVNMEQTEVQRLLGNLYNSDPAKYGRVISQINNALNGFVDRLLGKIFNTDAAYGHVLDKVRNDLKRDIDFSKQSDREAIGNALIQHIREPNGNDVNGR